MELRDIDLNLLLVFDHMLKEKRVSDVAVNLGLSQRLTLPDGGTWTLRFDVINLFDRGYQLRDGTGIGVGAPQYGMRRGFFAGLSRAI